MKKFTHTTISPALGFGLLLFCLAFASPVLAEEQSREPTVKVRNAAAITALKQENTVAIYAKGLCCPSCGIGVRKHLSKLLFVDKERFNKGIDLHVKGQLAIIAVKPDMVTDKAALTKAIVKAGYDPVELFQKRGDKVTKTFLASSK